MSIVERMKAAAASEMHALKAIERVALQLTDEGKKLAIEHIQSLLGQAQLLRVPKPRAKKGTATPPTTPAQG
jgi:hypothetical protein